MKEKSSNRLVVACGLAIVMLAVTGAFYFKAQADNFENVQKAVLEVPRVTVDVFRVQPQLRPLRFRTRGVLRGIEEVVVSSEINGAVLDRPVREGQTVQSGATLCRIDPTFHDLSKQAAKAVLQERQAALSNAEAELERLEDVSAGAKAAIEINRLSTTLDRARAAVDLAKAELEQAREQLERSLISSPIDGVISRVFVEKGELLTPGRPVVEIVNLGQMKLLVELTPAEVAQLTDDLDISVTTAAWPGETFAGRVAAVYPKANPATRRIPIEIHIENHDLRLRSGTFVNCEIVSRTTQSKLLIPAKGVLHDFASHYCLVAEPTEDGYVVARREISTRSVADSVTVLDAASGLEPGDLLIVTNHQEIRPDQVVELATIPVSRF